jgi:hypothetical protein
VHDVALAADPHQSNPGAVSGGVLKGHSCSSSSSSSNLPTGDPPVLLSSKCAALPAAGLVRMRLLLNVL